MRDEGITLTNMGNVLAETGDVERARAAFDRALAIVRELADHDSESITLQNIGEFEIGIGLVAEALESFRAALCRAREMGNRRSEAYALSSLGTALTEHGDFDEAYAAFAQARDILSGAPNRRLEGFVIAELGASLARDGRHAEAAARLAEGEAILARGRRPGRSSCAFCAAAVSLISPGVSLRGRPLRLPKRRRWRRRCRSVPRRKLDAGSCDCATHAHPRHDDLLHAEGDRCVLR